MGDLKAVLSALQGAKGGDKAVDRLIAREVGWHRVEPRHTSGKHGGWIAPDDWIGAHSDGSPILDGLHGTTIWREVTAYTASVDEALALVAEKLPGWEITIVTGMDGNAVQLFSPGRAPTVTVPHAASVAIGLLTALFSALSAQSEGQPK